MAFNPGVTPAGQAWIQLRQFLSALAWIEGAGVRDEWTLTGDVPLKIYRRPLSQMVTHAFRTDFFPEHLQPKPRLALALYREGLTLESSNLAYAFLSYFKILNVRFKTPKEQIAWIDSALPQLSFSYEAQARVAQLRRERQDPPTYLYGSGRSAIAHAYADPIVDPENPDDIERLANDLPVVKALAEHCIEQEFGVPSYQSVRLAHRYELDGFRDLLGTELLARLRTHEPIAPVDVPALPRLTLRVRDRAPLAALVDLAVTVHEVADGAIVLHLVSPDRRMHVILRLDFQKERLLFDPWGSVAVAPDDGSAEATRVRLDHLQLIWWLVLNGELEVWDRAKDRLLGRADPYLPVKVSTDLTEAGLREQYDALRAELTKRLTASTSSVETQAE
jgi:hypothetical protein